MRAALGFAMAVIAVLTGPDGRLSSGERSPPKTGAASCRTITTSLKITLSISLAPCWFP